MIVEKKSKEEITREIKEIIKRLVPLVEPLSVNLIAIDTLIDLNEVTHAIRIAEQLREIAESVRGSIAWIYKLLNDLKETIEREVREKW